MRDEDKNAQRVPDELVLKLFGSLSAVTFSPIVTIEPRRRKFHCPIKLKIPLPASYRNELAGNLRLLCSISAPQSRALWEDVTGVTPLSISDDHSSLVFTTTVSARFWLVHCRKAEHCHEIPRFAAEIYRHLICVPFMAKFVIFAKRRDINEAILRVFCMTDDKEERTLEVQEHYTQVAKSRDVEVLDGQPLYLEFGGNLVPTHLSGQHKLMALNSAALINEQLSFLFHAFQENRLAFAVRLREVGQEPNGRIAFMEDSIRYLASLTQHQRQLLAERRRRAVCTLGLTLPTMCVNQDNILGTPKRNSYYASARIGDLTLADIANELDASKGSNVGANYDADSLNGRELNGQKHRSRSLSGDWIDLAPRIGIPKDEVEFIADYCASNLPRNGNAGSSSVSPALILLMHWFRLSSPDTRDQDLARALVAIRREDIAQKLNFPIEPKRISRSTMELLREIEMIPVRSTENLYANSEVYASSGGRRRLSSSGSRKTLEPGQVQPSRSRSSLAERDVNSTGQQESTSGSRGGAVASGKDGSQPQPSGGKKQRKRKGGANNKDDCCRPIGDILSSGGSDDDDDDNDDIDRRVKLQIGDDIREMGAPSVNRKGITAAGRDGTSTGTTASGNGTADDVSVVAANRAGGGPSEFEGQRELRRGDEPNNNNTNTKAPGVGQTNGRAGGGVLSRPLAVGAASEEQSPLLAGPVKPKGETDATSEGMATPSAPVAVASLPREIQMPPEEAHASPGGPTSLAASLAPAAAALGLASEATEARPSERPVGTRSDGTRASGKVIASAECAVAASSPESPKRPLSSSGSGTSGASSFGPELDIGIESSDWPVGASVALGEQQQQQPPPPRGDECESSGDFSAQTAVYVPADCRADIGHEVARNSGDEHAPCEREEATRCWSGSDGLDSGADGPDSEQRVAVGGGRGLSADAKFKDVAGVGSPLGGATGHHHHQRQQQQHGKGAGELELASGRRRPAGHSPIEATKNNNHDDDDDGDFGYLIDGADENESKETTSSVEMHAKFALRLAEERATRGEAEELAARGDLEAVEQAASFSRKTARRLSETAERISGAFGLCAAAARGAGGDIESPTTAQALAAAAAAHSDLRQGERIAPPPPPPPADCGQTLGSGAETKQTRAQQRVGEAEIGLAEARAADRNNNRVSDYDDDDHFADFVEKSVASPGCELEAEIHLVSRGAASEKRQASECSAEASTTTTTNQRAQGQEYLVSRSRVASSFGVGQASHSEVNILEASSFPAVSSQHRYSLPAVRPKILELGHNSSKRLTQTTTNSNSNTNDDWVTAPLGTASSSISTPGSITTTPTTTTTNAEFYTAASHSIQSFVGLSTVNGSQYATPRSQSNATLTASQGGDLNLNQSTSTLSAVESHEDDDDDKDIGGQSNHQQASEEFQETGSDMVSAALHNRRPHRAATLGSMVVPSSRDEMIQMDENANMDNNLAAGGGVALSSEEAMDTQQQQQQQQQQTHEQQQQQQPPDAAESISGAVSGQLVGQKSNFQAPASLLEDSGLDEEHIRRILQGKRLSEGCNRFAGVFSGVSRKNSLHMIEELPPLTEGEQMRHMSLHLSASQVVAGGQTGELQIGATSSIASGGSSQGSSGSISIRSSGRLVGGMVGKQNSSSTDCSSSTSLDRSPTRRRSSTCSSVLSETSRNQLQFDSEPDLPLDASLADTNGCIEHLQLMLSLQDPERPSSPLPASPPLSGHENINDSSLSNDYLIQSRAVSRLSSSRCGDFDDVATSDSSRSCRDSQLLSPICGESSSCEASAALAAAIDDNSNANDGQPKEQQQQQQAAAKSETNEAKSSIIDELIDEVSAVAVTSEPDNQRQLVDSAAPLRSIIADPTIPAAEKILYAKRRTPHGRLMAANSIKSQQPTPTNSQQQQQNLLQEPAANRAKNLHSPSPTGSEPATRRVCRSANSICSSIVTNHSSSSCSSSSGGSSASGNRSQVSAASRSPSSSLMAGERAISPNAEFRTRHLIKLESMGRQRRELIAYSTEQDRRPPVAQQQQPRPRPDTSSARTGCCGHAGRMCYCHRRA